MRTSNSDRDKSKPELAEGALTRSRRRNLIAEAAYYRAKQRGFEPGYELEDWLAAENEVVKSWLERSSDTPE